MNATLVLLILLAAVNTVLLVLLWRTRSGWSGNVDVRLQSTEERIGRSLREEFTRNRKESAEQSRELRAELAAGVTQSGETIVKHVGVLTQTNEQKLGEVRQSMDQLIDRTSKRLDDVRGSVE